MRTLITGGTIVNADATTKADVLVDGETVALIGQSLDAAADRTIDASGKWVIPGAIDVHTHMELPFGGTFAKDTFETGTPQPPSEGRRRSSTSPSRARDRRCARDSTPGTPRPRARRRSTTAST